MPGWAKQKSFEALPKHLQKHVCLLGSCVRLANSISGMMLYSFLMRDKLNSGPSPRKLLPSAGWKQNMDRFCSTCGNDLDAPNTLIAVPGATCIRSQGKWREKEEQKANVLPLCTSLHGTCCALETEPITGAREVSAKDTGDGSEFQYPAWRCEAS